MRLRPLKSVLTKPKITREQLKAYAQASLDPNTIHLDDDAAKKAGLPGVIAHGMLTMAFFGEYAYLARTELAPDSKLVDLQCRFRAMTFPGDEITVTGTVKTEDEKSVICDMSAKKQSGEVTATGHFTLKKL